MPKRNHKLVSYINAKLFLKKYNFLSSYEYHNHRKSNGKFDINIPYNSKKYYKKMGEWISWHHFLSINEGNNYKFLSFDKARNIIRNLKLKNQKEWSQWCKINSSKFKIPTNPNIIYKNKGWKS